MAAGIYAITCAGNSKEYIGSAVDMQGRWRVHLSRLKTGLHHSLKLQRSYDKYGPDSFVFSVVESVLDRKQLVVREQFWIDAKQPWMNMVAKAGSLLGHRWTDAQKRNASRVQKIASSYRVNPLKGTVGLVSDETRAKLKAARAKQICPKGRKLTAEHKAQLSIAKRGKSSWSKGKTLSAEHRAKLSLAKIGRKLPPRSAEWCRKISIHKKAYWAVQRGVR